MMGFNNQLVGFLVAFALFALTNAWAGSVDGELELILVAQADCQSDTGECAEDGSGQLNEDEEDQTEEDEEPDCE